jgi:quercetin dioxygenase-like cupin family protein
MVRTRLEQIVEFKCIRGGNGEAEMHKITNNDAELYGKGRMFNRVILAPGRSIGEHTHTGDNEIYYILSGSGTYNDNGTILKVHAGDTTICNDGEMHGLVNDSDEPLEMIALVLYN